MFQPASESNISAKKSNGASPKKAASTGPSADEIEVMKIPVKKFSLADMERWQGPLLARIKREHPYFSDQAILGRITQWMASNKHMFIRTERSIGLATIGSEEMDPRPFVNVLFLWCERDHESKKSGVRLCREFERWCKELRAKEVQYTGSIDFQHNDMVALAGVETGRTIYYKTFE